MALAEAFARGATERGHDTLRVADSPACSISGHYIRFGRAVVSVAGTAARP